MKPKKIALGIKFLDGEIKNVLYLSPTRNGYVMAIPDFHKHTTIVDEGDVISSHTTDQITLKRTRLGELLKNGDYDEVLEKTYKLRKLEEDEYDKPVIYWTRKGIELFGEPYIKFDVVEAKEYVGYYVDLSRMFADIEPLAREFIRSPESFYGTGIAKDVLSNEDIMLGMESDKIGIVEIDEELYEMDLTTLLDPLETETPLRRVIEPLGFISLIPAMRKRFQDITDKKRHTY